MHARRGPLPCARGTLGEREEATRLQWEAETKEGERGGTVTEGALGVP